MTLRYSVTHSLTGELIGRLHPSQEAAERAAKERYQRDRECGVSRVLVISQHDNAGKLELSRLVLGQIVRRD